MAWNYRVIVDDTGHQYIAEVFYDDDGNIKGYGPPSTVQCNDDEFIQDELQLMSRACLEPRLHISELEE